MGQVLLDPPNVAGWPGGRTWLGTSTWFARVNTAAKLMNGGVFDAGAGTSAPKVVAAKIDTLFPALPASADDAIDQAVRGLVDGRISDEVRATLLSYLDEGGGYVSLPKPTKDLRIRGLATLVLSSPEYQLA
jgi:hypothetical protein